MSEADPTPPEGRGLDGPERAPGDAPGDDAIIGRAVRISLGLLAALAVVGLGVFVALRPAPAPEVVIEKDMTPPAPLVQEEPDRPRVAFVDVTAEAGIAFVHRNGATGDKLLPETMGGGSAFLDYDLDGDPDLLLVGGRAWEETEDAPSSLALYRNDGRGHFEDVTVAAGLARSLYGMGVAVGDHDRDGDPDVYVTAVGPNVLWRNEGDGTFVDVTGEAGVAGGDEDFGTAAGFLDHDGDGDLDLFVADYVRWSREIDLELDFQIAGLGRAYGQPVHFEGAQPTLFRNEGDGTFTDVSAEAGIHVESTLGTPAGKALGLAFVDVDSDGLVDVLVANDTVRNFLFLNRGDGTFEEFGAAAGVAFDGAGKATGAMGIDVADPRNDGRWAVGIGNFANEATSLYVQQERPLSFADLSATEGVASPSRVRLSFGLLFLDYDLDGRLDLLQANGHLEEEIHVVQASQHYLQPAQLFWNAGPDARSTFVEVPTADTGALGEPMAGRGLNAADVDGDGDLDVLLTQPGGPPRLLRNDQATGHHWIRLLLRGQGPTSNPDAYGAVVELTTPDGVTQRRVLSPTRSYLAQVEPVLTFGLGGHDAIDALTIHWPDGAVQHVEPLPGIDALHVIGQPLVDPI